jgi:anti-anti-sigma regulatory factor
MMRRHGEVSRAAGLVPFAHLGWGYRDRPAFLARAAEWIADGLACNQLVLYVGDRDRPELRAELAEMGFGDEVRSGRIRPTPVADYFTFVPGSDVIDAEAMAASSVTFIESLVAKGYTGLRNVTDATAVARTPQQRDALARYEYLAEQVTAARPVSGLCAYDVSSLGEAAKEIVCLHPLVSVGTVGFRLYDEAGVGLSLAGEIDAADGKTFSTALQRIWPLQTGPQLIVDGRGLDFLTHRELAALDRLAGAGDQQVVIRTDNPVVARLAQLLEPENVRVAPPTTPADAVGEALG